MKTRPVGVAVVGLGNIGKVHARLIRELERDGVSKLVAVVDQVPQVAEDVGRKLSVPYHFTLDSVLKDHDVEVLVIATPTYMHSPQAIMALEYGKDVIVEKPLSTTLAGAKELSSRARKLGRKVGVVYQERYAPELRELKSAVDGGKMGRIFLLEAQLSWYRDEIAYYKKDELARSWRGLWNTEGGGVLTNQGIHTVDLICWLGGKVEEVFGFTSNADHPSITVEDTAVGVIKFSGGALASLSLTVSARPSDRQFRRLRVVGTEGQAEVTDYTITSMFTREGRRSGPSVTNSDTVTQSGGLHMLLLRDFLKAYADGGEFPINAEEGTRALEVIKGLYVSSWTGRSQRIPLDLNYVA
ncbi:Gfo/Idh/MocA family protein [Sulfodiicoccus acidiphilus]|uniref:Gfo/Idh/MocA family protein n=1 Tax=Sulfodiicoccus acidiphilus TaxID=1670455 RepID=UPI001E51B623|nr:Gfo/Idh/MocA family oxidoreductase [Sulfodiicoccus acidiphilus]